MEPLQVGDPDLIGRYRLIGRLGVGGMGRVYLGVTPEGRQAAVKVIRDDLADDTGFRARFRREVAAATAVAGMFTARVLDADADGDPPWLATQYIEGPSLRDAVLARGPMPEDRLVPLAQGLAEALAAIHAAGLTHRDLKPANVLLSPTGPIVIDFGIARTADSTQLTATGQVIGTPDYMAPEQIDGTSGSGPPADVFAFGSTLAFAATGRGPFAAEQTAATLYRILHAEPDLRGIPRRMAGVIGACLAKDPAQRPQAVQLAVALRSGANAAAPEAAIIAAPEAATIPAPEAAASVADLTALRDDSPTPQVGSRFGAVVEEFSSARSAFADARSRVAGSEPLTIGEYRKAVSRFRDGARNLALAASLVQGVTLPPDYTAASAAAPRCAG